MRVEVKERTALRSHHSKYLDLRSDFGLAGLMEDNGSVTLSLDDIKYQ